MNSKKSFSLGKRVLRALVLAQTFCSDRITLEDVFTKIGILDQKVKHRWERKTPFRMMMMMMMMMKCFWSKAPITRQIGVFGISHAHPNSHDWSKVHIPSSNHCHNQSLQQRINTSSIHDRGKEQPWVWVKLLSIRVSQEDLSSRYVALVFINS